MQQIKLALIAPQNRHAKFGLYPKYGRLPQFAVLQTGPVICIDATPHTNVDVSSSSWFPLGPGTSKEDQETGITC